MSMNPNLASMLDKFDGCEGGDSGSITNPTIWLFGVEPGWSKFDQKNPNPPANPMDDGYSINTQIKWIYNRNAFKLLAAIDGMPVSNYREFAHERQPFAQGSKGYFKGNLYPYACNKLTCWPQDAIEETGLANKAEYQTWCAKYRFPAIKSWVDEHQPKIFIGVGNTFRDQFVLAVFGHHVELKCQTITINGHNKNIFFAQDGSRKLVVLPHLSGGRNGLNSNESIRQTGVFINNFLKS
ncbi:MAG: hypothetical protein ACN6OM_09815 [Alcaligenes nematophilus]|uniref:hypothetical protein n=1 Tax=Alcaligenes nematophilus TaxID=2994643 RepID=UPI003CFF0400